MDSGESVNGKDVVINSLHKPQSLDEFDINIIMLDDLGMKNI